MNFSSLIFLFLFLPAVLILYYLTPKRFRNLTLFLVDIVFYAWGEPRLVILMLFSIVLNYAAGVLIAVHRERKKLAKGIFVLAIVLNVGLLAFFKYAGFIADTLRVCLPFLNIPVLEIPLPIGISFYTFQTMSYTIDVYRNTVQVQKNILTFGTYVSLFPQLIAGPIVRYADVEQQLTERRESIRQFTEGVKLFSVGLAKKVLLANEMGRLWDVIRQSGNEAGAIGAWVGIIAYTFQIYFDFCGYSEMAMGLGKMFGFEFLKNFDYPYLSKSITEFWRRWHISLGTWFREYVYIPLGGNRKGLVRQIFNIAVVWLLTGLWHGASWNFVLWGAYFGVILIVEKLFLLKKLQKAPPLVSHLYSLFFIVIGWVLFYFEDMGEMGEFFCRLFALRGVGMSGDVAATVIAYLPLLAAAAVASTSLVHKLYATIRSQRVLCAVDVAGCALSLVLCTASLVGSGFNPFLYFRF